MQALTTVENSQPIVKSIPIPEPSKGEILVKTKAVGLNPSDYKSAPKARTGLVVGYDWAGVVAGVGSGVDNFKLGDRVAGIIVGGTSERTGAFAEYIAVRHEFALKLPDGFSFESAASFGVGWITSALAVGQKLFKHLEGVANDSPILIYSASSNTGMYAIQYIRQLQPSRPVIALASPSNHELLKSFGATHTFDYRHAGVVEQVREVSTNIVAALDCFAADQSWDLCMKCMSTTEQGLIVGLLPPTGRFLVTNIKKDFVLSYTVSGEDVKIGSFTLPARPQDLVAGTESLKVLESLLAEQKIISVPTESLTGGIEGIVGGLKRLEEGSVRGKKLIVPL